MSASLTDAEHGRRKQRLIAILDRIGELIIEEIDEGDLRVIMLRASAPGHSLRTEATFEYRERFDRDRKAWRLSAYAYEYREEPPPGRLAYHWHDRGFHAHCVERGGSSVDHHYRAHEVTFFEAHEEFARIYARDEPVSCERLRPTLGTRAP